MKSTKRIAMLIIDPQNDFCDVADSNQIYQPALPVNGATNDMRRLARLITRIGTQIGQITVTLDTHSPYDIAHPVYWTNAAAETPLPYMEITEEDVTRGVWRPRNPDMQEHVIRYVRALKEKGRYVLRIWPEHCIEGSWGHNVQADVRDALDDWARQQFKVVDYALKGTNPGTEHYSAVEAEVPDAVDPDTQVNWRIVSIPSNAETVLIAGEALSHCVASTVRDMASRLSKADIAKMVLLIDCMSPVPGFERQGQEFIAEMIALGMRLAVSTEFEI